MTITEGSLSQKYLEEQTKLAVENAHLRKRVQEFLESNTRLVEGRRAIDRQAMLQTAHRNVFDQPVRHVPVVPSDLEWKGRGSVSRLRIFVFPARPDALLLFQEEGPLELPVLSAPFSRTPVAEACGQAGLRATVSEMTPGRWSYTMTRDKLNARSAAFQQNKLREMSTAALSKGSTVPEIRERGELLARKLELDEAARDLKKRIGEAKSAAHFGKGYMNPIEFRRLESELVEMKNESVLAEMRLGELKKAQKARNVEAGDTYERRFKTFVWKLDPELYQEVVDALNEEDAELSEEG